jgi:hypothetical protein
MTLGQLLSAGWFRVPGYQRPYSWTEEEVRELWEDLKAQLMQAGDGTHYHFFGTLLTVDSSLATTPQASPLEILDGQQRLATFNLLLIAVDRELEEIEESEDASPKVRKQAREGRDRIADAVFRSRERGQRRLELRAEEDQLLGNILQGNPPGHSKLGDAFRNLHSAVRDYAKESPSLVNDLQQLVGVVLDRSVVIHARCIHGFDPFAVFSTLNARGLPLSAAQILRARMLGLVSDMGSGVQELTKKCWDRIEGLGEDGDRYLGYYLTARIGERIPAKEVVRRFDRSILSGLKKEGEHPEDKFGALAGELHDMTGLYEAIARGDWPVTTLKPVSDWRQRRLRLLVRELGVRQAVPLILAVAHRTPDSLADAVDTIERAAFVALMCFPNQTRWGEKLFEWAAGVYAGEKNASELPNDVRLWFIQQLGNPERALAENIPIQLRYGGKKRTQLRYFLTTLNDLGFPKPSPGRPDEQAGWDLRKIQLEHVSPKSVPDGVPDHDKDRLGNLTPLYGPTNAALGNQPFAAKKAMYRDSPLRITSGLAALDKWDALSIRRREEAMVDFAVKVYCRDMRV